MIRRMFAMMIFAFGSIAMGQITDIYQGEYEGTFEQIGRPTLKAAANVVVEGKGEYRIRAWAEGGEGAPLAIEVPAKLAGETLRVDGKSWGVSWKGDLGSTKTLVILAPDGYGHTFTLKKAERQSPTLGMAPPAGAVVLLPWKEGVAPDLSEWTEPSWKSLPEGAMEVGSKNNVTKRKFHDYDLHVEFWLPLEPEKRGQGRGNSGVYMNEVYELQVLDSFGLPARSGDAGAVYKVANPLVNASLPPERWQTYDISFRAPRLDATGKLVEPARLTAKLNGILVQENTEVRLGTGSSKIKGNPERGGIMLQNHKHPVRYRNIWLVEK